MTQQEVQQAMADHKAVTFEGQLAKIVEATDQVIRIRVPSSSQPITVTADQLTAR